MITNTLFYDDRKIEVKKPDLSLLCFKLWHSKVGSYLLIEDGSDYPLILTKSKEGVGTNEYGSESEAFYHAFETLEDLKREVEKTFSLKQVSLIFLKDVS
jgi:hypothetical protein